MIFVNRHYAEAVSPTYSTSPRAFLLSLTSTAPSHALLVADWGKEGAAVLSVPTRDYFQSSAWTNRNAGTSGAADARDDNVSVRTGSAFWASGRGTPTTSGQPSDTEDDRSQYGQAPEQGNDIVDEVDAELNLDPLISLTLIKVGSADAFIAGMIYALTRCVLPGKLEIQPSPGV